MGVKLEQLLRAPLHAPENLPAPIAMTGGEPHIPSNVVTHAVQRLKDPRLVERLEKRVHETEHLSVARGSGELLRREQFRLREDERDFNECAAVDHRWRQPRMSIREPV